MSRLFAGFVTGADAQDAHSLADIDAGPSVPEAVRRDLDADSIVARGLGG